MRLNILLLTDTHSPDGGGAEKHFFSLKKLLNNQPDTQVTSLGFGPHAMQGDDFIILKETRSKALRQFWRMFINPLKYRELRKAIQKINPDVIHLHNIKKYTPTLLKAIQGYPVIQTVHDFSLICPTQWNIHRDRQPCQTGFSLKCCWQHRRHYHLISYFSLVFSFLRMRHSLKKSITHFISPSPLLAAYLTKHGFKQVTVLPPFLETLSFPPPQKIPENHFLYLGQLEKQKGIDILLREFYFASQKNHHITLTIAGRGSEEQHLKEKVRAWQLENKVHFVGWQSDPSALYAACTAVIFPSIGLESFGLVITEAMAHARPIIGSNRGPTAWLVEHEKTGFLFDPLKQGDLANYLLKLADENSALAQRLGEHAYEKLKTLPNCAEVLKKIIAIYRTATLTHHKQPTGIA